MKVVSVCSSDWANLQFNFDAALKEAGVESYSYKLNTHPFGYAQESRVISSDQLRSVIEHTKIIVLFHSDWELLEGIDLSGKIIIPYHTGTKYRTGFEAINKKLNYILTLTDQTEFIKHRHMEYLAAAINTRVPKFGHTITRPVVAHYPSNPMVKGTELINRVVSSIAGDFEYKHSTQIVPHPEQLKRINDCDIYVELFNPKLGEHEYGCFGVTAFEAAAAGKIVVTQNLNNNVYQIAYGECPFILCSTEEELRYNLTVLVKMRPAELSEIQTKTYNWLINTHSYKATAERFLNLLNKYYGSL